MRILTTIALGGLLAAGAFADSRTGFTALSRSEAERHASGYVSPDTSLSMWIWSDKYSYKAGDAVTLRWTVKTNNDLYPYTVVVYRQNNQTGAKVYYPGASASPVDINGNTVDAGFQPMRLSDVTKGVLIGSGGTIPSATLPDELGMHTFAVELRDYTGTRILKSSYMKVGVVSEQVTVSGDVTADTTWVNTKSYLLKGVVHVKNNAVLTIQPGTIIQGASGSQPPSLLLVTRNGRIQAAGTKSRPIIMTSAQPFGQRKRGDWGGLILLGKAPINVGANTSGGICGTGASCNNAKGTFYIEGLVADDDGLYGGDNPAHNCGTLQYVRVEYAGSILSSNNETNSFTWGGCGTGTVAEHLQAIYGMDDSFEWFGGTMNAKYLVGGLGADDYVDFQLGYVGKIQYGLFYQTSDAKGNRGIEGDNSEYDNAAEPFSNPTMYNLTFVGSGVAGYDETNSPGVFLRRGSRGTFNNILVINFFSGAMELNDANTIAQANAGNITMNGLLMWGNNIGASGANTMAGQLPNAGSLTFAQGTPAGKAQNMMVANPSLIRINQFSDPNFKGAFASPVFRTGWVQPPDDGFFDQTARFIGGIGDEDWTAEWTSFLQEPDIQ